MSELQIKLTRSEVRRTLLRSQGTISAIARDLSVTPTAVSLVLKGKAKSARILKACEERARMLLEAESMVA